MAASLLHAGLLATERAGFDFDVVHIFGLLAGRRSSPALCLLLPTVLIAVRIISSSAAIPFALMSLDTVADAPHGSCTRMNFLSSCSTTGGTTTRWSEPAVRPARLRRLFFIVCINRQVAQLGRSAAVPRARWCEISVGLVSGHFQAPTTERAVVSSLASDWPHFRRDDGRSRLSLFREIRFRPFGHPPFFAFSRAALVLAADERAPKSAPTLIGFPQCGQFSIRSTTGGPPSRRQCISGGPRRARASLASRPR